MQETIIAQDIISLTTQGEQLNTTKTEENTIVPDPKSGSHIVYNVSKPSLTIYRPEGTPSNGIGVLVIPGGAFHILAYDDEGVNIAKLLAAKGYTAVVLKYRLVQLDENDPFGKLMRISKNFDTLESVMVPVVPLAVEDGKTAMKYLQDHAPELGIESGKIGVMGFSAGGTLAAAIALDKDVRPLFSTPIYPYLNPVIKNEVPADPPPVFIAVTEDDDFEFDINSLKFYNQWKTAKGLAELHVYTKGRHGFASKKQGLPVDHWMNSFLDWLSSMGYGSK